MSYNFQLGTTTARKMYFRQPPSNINVILCTFMKADKNHKKKKIVKKLQAAVEVSFAPVWTTFGNFLFVNYLSVVQCTEPFESTLKQHMTKVKTPVLYVLPLLY